METYKFYIQMDGATYGPYSATAVRDLELLDDILVTEESMNGKWLPASRFDFDDMAKKETGYATVQTSQSSQQLYQPSTKPVAPHYQADSAHVDYGRTTDNSWSTYDPNTVPQEIKKWNWGAFFFGWLWGICNGLYWPLLMILVSFIPYIGQVLAFAISIALGIKGNEWAWKSKAWDGVEHFKRVQHKWAIACLWVLGICAAFAIIYVIAGS